jgi:DNA processing protein
VVAGRLAEGMDVAAGFAAQSSPRLDPVLLARRCAQRDIRLLLPTDLEFPELLRQIPDPPLLIYVQGDPDALRAPAVAVIGARRCTRLGIEVAGSLAGALAVHGVVIVSGLARGIDAAAHRAALPAGRTVAVLGSGLECPYPAAHRPLARSIVDRGGALVSEYLPWASPRPYHFPERNRLISGLAAAVVVVEAGEHSGSLITARLALEQGREVLAVPGPVTSATSRGCHRLLRQGAALAETADDVLETLGWSVGEAVSPSLAVPVDPAMGAVLAAVEGAGSTLDQIVAASGLPAAAAAALLVELELAGFVRQVRGGYIRRPFP